MKTAIFSWVLTMISSGIPCIGETLVEDGSGRMDIVISENASPAVQHAATEPQYCIG